jgi:HSP20 family molecular chaperone IbpA
MVNVAGYQQAAKSLEKAGVNISGKKVSSKRQKEKRKERRRKREEAARKRLEAEAQAQKAEAEATLKSGLVSPTSTVQMKDGKRWIQK